MVKAIAGGTTPPVFCHRFKARIGVSPAAMEGHLS
jgi:hypothetical protein